LLPWAREHERGVALILTAAVFVALVARELRASGLRASDWDLLFMSGCATAVAGLWLARGQDRRFEVMLGRLGERHALVRRRERQTIGGRRVARRDVATFRNDLKTRAEAWATVGGVIVAAVMVGLFVIFYILAGRPALVALGGTLVGASGGFLIGRHLGRMVCYGLLDRFLDRKQMHFRAVPGHVDGAAGLKPLGDFFLRQAGLLAVPAVFLLVWTLIFLLPAWHDRYEYWQAPYLGLLAAVIALELAAFVVPLWSVHGDMKANKLACLPDADRLGGEIARVRRELERDLSGDDRGALRDRLDQLMARYREIETMPTWPVDRSIKRWLTLGNAALIVPLLTQVAALAGFE
jgi:hypothetical protein